MSLKCKNCGCEDLQPSFKRCPQCGLLLSSEVKSEEYYNYKNNIMATDYKKDGSEIELVKNTVFWSLNPGEVARRINVNEFENIKNAKGVYVQEGVIAVLMIDGKKVVELTSGVYYFQTATERFVDSLRHIWRFFTGRKKNDTDNEYGMRTGRLGSELQNITKQSFIDVVLMTEGVIPIVLGVEPQDGTTQFAPYKISANLNDINVGVSMTLRVTDFYKFRVNYLTKSSSCRIYDIQNLLYSPICNTIQEVLAYETIEALVFPPMVKERLRNAIANKAKNILLGVEVEQIIDITLKNEDFERFRKVEQKLYCSKRELDYLIRTNDFKNRLQSEENAQTIAEAKTEEDLRYALNNLNKDKLLHDDEMEAFCQLLASKKDLRAAKTEAELEKALLDIKKNSLISNDDFKALESELRINQSKRDEVEEIFRWQSLKRSESERILAQKEIDIQSVNSEKDIEQAEYELNKQVQTHVHDLENEDQKHINILEKEKVRHTTGINDIIRDDIIKDEDVNLKIRKGKHEADIKELSDLFDLNDREGDRAIEKLGKIQDIEIKKMVVENEEERKNKAQDFEHEEKMEEMKNKAEISRAEITKGMSSSQIAATNLDKLSESSQIELFKAISANEKMSLLEAQAEEKVRIIEKYTEKLLDKEREFRKNQEATTDKFFDFAEKTMKNNSELVSKSLQGQADLSKGMISTAKDIYTHRVGELIQDKDEYREEAHHAQSRVDHTQDSALHYTTSKAKSEATAEAFKGAQSYSMSDIIDKNIRYCMIGGVYYTYFDILDMIYNGEITPNTEMHIDGKIFTAYDRNEYKESLNKKYGAECECGQRGVKGRKCEECGSII